MINSEYNGVNFLITEELIHDLKNLYNIDAIKEIKRGISLSQKNLNVKMDINDGKANLVVTKC